MAGYEEFSGDDWRALLFELRLLVASGIRHVGPGPWRQRLTKSPAGAAARATMPELDRAIQAPSERRSELAKSFGFGRKAPAPATATKKVRKPRAP
jgi:hypothetical protein